MPALVHAAAVLVALSHGFYTVAGCGCVSLLQTSAQIQNPQPRHAEPHHAQPHKAAVKRQPVLRASKNKQTPDTAAVEAKIDEANATLSTVTDMLAEINATCAELIGPVDAALTTALAALEQVKAGAAMLGPDVSKTVANIADQFIAAVTKLQAMLDEASTEVESTVEKLTIQITTLTDKVFGNFQTAVDRVNGLTSEPTPAPALLQADRSTQQGPFDWLIGGPSKYQKARNSITKANNTVAQLDAMLDSINATAVSLLTENTIGVVQSGLQQIQTALDTANLPAPVVASVNGAVSKLDGIVASLSSKVTQALSTIETEITNARASLPMLYAAADSLMAMVDTAEEASKSS